MSKKKQKLKRIQIARCGQHDAWAIIVDDIRITPYKCCGSWDIIKTWETVEPTTFRGGESDE